MMFINEDDDDEDDEDDEDEVQLNDAVELVQEEDSDDEEDPDFNQGSAFSAIQHV